MENKRRKIHEELEVVKAGFANGVAKGFPLSLQAKSDMIAPTTTKQLGELFILDM